MKTRRLILAALISMVTLPALSQTPGGARAVPPIPGAGAAPAKSTANPGQTGTQNPPRGTIPPDLNQQMVLTNQFGNFSNQVGNLSNQFGMFTNQNQFGMFTNQAFFTNQVVNSTNFILVQTDQFGNLIPQTLPPTSAATNTSRVYPTNAAALTNFPATMNQDRAANQADRMLLVQIHRGVRGALGSSTALVSVHFLVQNGVVNLVGLVPTLDQKQRILDIVQNTPGVVQVVDQLDVRPQAGQGTGTGAPVLNSTQFGLTTTNVSGVTVPLLPLSVGTSNQVGVTVTNQFVTTNQFGFGPVSNPTVASTNLTPTSRSNGASRVFPLPPGLQPTRPLPPGLQNRDTLPPGLEFRTNATPPATNP